MSTRTTREVRCIIPAAASRRGEITNAQEPRNTTEPRALERPRASSPRVVALAFAVAALFVLQQRLIDVAARAQHAPALPFPVLDPTFGPPTSIHVVLVAVGAAQTAVLFLLYRALLGRDVDRSGRIGIALAALAMLVTGLFAATLTSFDTYAYIGYAKLASLQAAYAPPPIRFPGALGAINDTWGTPMVPSYYGPAWLVLDRLVAGPAATFGAAIAGLRLLDVAALAAIVAVFARLRAGAAVVVLLALNPALDAMYVANAHNDLVAIAFVVFALALAGAFPFAAAACVAVAGSMKLPLVALALVVFAGKGRIVQRLGWVGLVVLLVAVVSWLFAGGDYVHDLIFRLHQGNVPVPGLNGITAKIMKAGLLVVAAFALVTVFVRGVVWRAASWSLITLSSIVYPWYLAWSLPYAARERGALVQLLVALPLVAALLDVSFAPLGLGQLAMLAMLAYAAYDIVRGKPEAVHEIVRPGP